MGIPYLLCQIDNFTSKIVTKEYKSKNGEEIIIDDNYWSFALLRVHDKNSKFYWSTHILLNTTENHIIHYAEGVYLNTVQIRWDANDKKLFNNYYYISGEGNNIELEYILCFYIY